MSVPPQGLDRSSPIPYYFQLQQILRELIEQGELTEDERLPGENQLCESFEVSRTVVRQALGELENEGLVERHKGRGTFVAKKKLPDFLVQKLTGLYEEALVHGRRIQSTVRKLERVPAGGPIARELALVEGDPVILLDRIRYIDGELWTANTTYLPYELCPELLDEDMTRQSLYELLENRYRITIATAKRSVEAILASTSIAKALGIGEGAAVLVLRSISFTDDGRPVEYFVSYYPGEKSLFEVTLSRRSGSTAAVND
jgi:GntR family transcriptional regulator